MCLTQTSPANLASQNTPSLIIQWRVRPRGPSPHVHIKTSLIPRSKLTKSIDRNLDLEPSWRYHPSPLNRQGWAKYACSNIPRLMNQTETKSPNNRFGHRLSLSSSVLADPRIKAFHRNFLRSRNKLAPLREYVSDTYWHDCGHA